MNVNIRRYRVLSAVTALIFTGACSGEVASPDTPGTEVSAKLPADQQAELDALLAKLKASENLTAADFASQYKVPFAAGLSYDPTKAQNLPLIQASALALDAGETSKLGEHGFVISKTRHFPTFTYGYASIYAEDLPVFISADSILFALHRSYDNMLEQLEVESLIPELGTLLDDMRSSLSAGGASALGTQARVDADLFLAVARSLLSNAPVEPLAGASAADIKALVAGANAASGAKPVSLFGSDRDVDFSQFKPRGHYTNSVELQQYFRAMMWLGRMDFRLLEAQPDLTLKFQRRQLEGALALGALMSGTTKDRWGRIDSAITTFVGEHDYMIVPQLDSLLADLKVTDLGALAKVSDETISRAILDGKYGTQRISSHIMVNGVGKGTMPLSSSFALFGQRYVVDSHVFSNVVYDRVQHGEVHRMMPSPLDVAFAALKNNQAGQLLGTELEKYKYAPDLNGMRILVDAHPQDYWEGNLYNLWLSSLQTLSPSADVADPAAAGLPSVMATEAWGRRLLNTQLASWAELRHDTILYAKQSYTGGVSCEFPDAYVEPNPAFFKAIDAYAQRGQELLSKLDLTTSGGLAPLIPAYFDQLHTTASRLASMAEQERTGTPFTPEQMAFINEAVVIKHGDVCGAPDTAAGWYTKLFFNPDNSVKFDPTIADVHTQPTDEAGNDVGRVLHVGTGDARLLTLTVDTCTGPRAYVGLTSSYLEEITKDYKRLDDDEWKSRLYSAAPPGDVPWVKDLIAP